MSRLGKCLTGAKSVFVALISISAMSAPNISRNIYIRTRKYLFPARKNGHFFLVHDSASINSANLATFQAYPTLSDRSTVR